MRSFARWLHILLIVLPGVMACGSEEPQPAVTPVAGSGGANGGSAAVGGAGVGGSWSSGGAGGGGTAAGSSGAAAGRSGSGGTTAGSSGAAAGRSGSGGTAGSGGVAGTTAGSGGAAGGGGAAATEFCSDYQTHCGFGAAMRYTNTSDCTTKYAAWTAERQMCIEMHLGFVSAKMGTADYESYKTMHCPHANGLGPCAAETTP